MKMLAGFPGRRPTRPIATKDLKNIAGDPTENSYGSGISITIALAIAVAKLVAIFINAARYCE